MEIWFENLCWRIPALPCMNSIFANSVIRKMGPCRQRCNQASTGISGAKRHWLEQTSGREGRKTHFVGNRHTLRYFNCWKVANMTHRSAFHKRPISVQSLWNDRPTALSAGTRETFRPINAMVQAIFFSGRFSQSSARLPGWLGRRPSLHDSMGLTPIVIAHKEYY